MAYLRGKKSAQQTVLMKLYFYYRKIKLDFCFLPYTTKQFKMDQGSQFKTLNSETFRRKHGVLHSKYWDINHFLNRMSATQGTTLNINR